MSRDTSGGAGDGETLWPGEVELNDLRVLFQLLIVDQSLHCRVGRTRKE